MYKSKNLGGIQEFAGGSPGISLRGPWVPSHSNVTLEWGTRAWDIRVCGGPCHARHDIAPLQANSAEFADMPLSIDSEDISRDLRVSKFLEF